jgi:hypothetical protein
MSHQPMNSIPSAARVTTSYREFCRLITEKLVDTQYCIRSLSTKIEKEYHILNNAKTLSQRDKRTIQNYVHKMETDIKDLIQIRDELLKLKNNEAAMQRTFAANKN